MNRSELKTWAKSKIKGKMWPLLGAIVVASIITNFSFTYTLGNNSRITISVGWLLYFVEVGITYYMINFITDKETNFKDLFKFSSDFAKDLVVGLLASIFTFLWALLLIVPGIIKGISYSLVPMLLGDDKYKDLKGTDYLKKSAEIMNGHKMDYFVLTLSFIGWHLLAILTLGILEIWIIPYQKTATIKFLYDVKTNFEK